MTSGMTPEEALTALQAATGKDVLQAVRGKVEEALQGKSIQLAAVQGELSALRNVARLIDSMLRPVPAGADPSGEAPPLSGETELSKERQARLLAGECTHRDRNKKWCQRKLANKMEKQEGYCSLHLVELGIADRDPVTGKVTYRKAGG